MADKSKLVQTLISKPTYSALVKLAKRDHRSIASYLRMLIEEAIESEEKK